MKYLRSFFKTVKPVRWALVLSVLCQIVQIFVALSYIYLSKALVDLATGVVEPYNWAVGSSQNPVRDGLVIFGIAMVVMILVRIMLSSAQSYIEDKCTIKTTNRLRSKLFDTLLHLGSDYRSSYHSGDIVSRTQSDVSTVSNAFCISAPNLIGTVLKFLAAVAYLVYLEPRLAWILIIVLPAGAFGGKFVMSRIRQLTLDVRKGDSAVQSHVQESVQHMTLLKTLEYVPNSTSELNNLQEDLYSKVLKRTRFSILARFCTAIAFSGGYAIAFLWGVHGIYIGTISYGVMTALLQLVGQIQRPLMEMSRELPTLFHCTASIDRIKEIEDLPGEPVGEPVMMSGAAGIKVSDLKFRYKDGSVDVFDGFSHDFKPGSRTAIVGPTGVGKSTLIKLFLALEQPDEGTVSIYDSNSCVPASAATRCNLVYVPQGNSLFSGTIRENLMMGNPAATDAELLESLHRAAADFVSELPDGMDTQCFEAGGGLSEGQAQRIAIARALLRPGSILLLDEFSSALDPQTEELMLTRLTAEGEHRTMIFITHRKKVADYCDNMLKL